MTTPPPVRTVQHGEPVTTPYTSFVELWGWRSSDGRHHISFPTRTRALDVLVEARAARPDLTFWLASKTVETVTVNRYTQFTHEGI